MTETKDAPYRVLARKYRPQRFSDLIGQDAMVRTLKNAFDADRIAHAFILTGVRGVGKTTTARIVAKGLNCTGTDGRGGPTTEPCDRCDACLAIAEGRHVDVLEMDAASRTGVGDIREIIEGVAYRATSARYKVYIIDEVHMLSTNAFNALLKTLEEPPEHVKFLFATTEIRKVPVTVLSRCQRFDLRRVEPEVMLAHLTEIAAREEARIAADALALIVRAAEGSVRDALSLLDQAIAHGGSETTADQVRAMLGLADRGRMLDLFDRIMRGDAAGALAEAAGQYADGADPAALLHDLAEITHWVSLVKVTPDAAEDPTIAPDERARGLTMADGLPMRVLTRTWQMLLTALDEVARAPNPMMAAEMAIIRLTHVADLPTPGDLVKTLRAAPEPRDGPAPGQAAPPDPAPVPRAGIGRHGPTALALQPQTDPLARYASFEDVLALIRDRRDLKLLVEVEAGLRLAGYAPGRIAFEPAPGTAPDLASRLAARLQGWTGGRWTVSVVSTGGAATAAERRAAEAETLRTEACRHPLVAAALATFPGAEVTEIRQPPAEPPSEPDLAPAPSDEGWDPFEESG
ncbi:MAG TPA: DNA polymerase III subunit gamma/tau [Rhodobacteraceae bacterium]|mgnify:CR=1 FL=1|jgi:DNA polymerase-3 subunit gamma/tau|nr:DNA polymerase III subunit gamma/tau [Paracoccaceae bacterium]HBG99483.1 DNA polymerase III subunit gamma/tau [Paracoccaceae bacterium]